MSRTIINARREIWSDSISVHLGVKDESGLSVARPVAFVLVPHGEVTDPFLNLQLEDAQKLMDALWDCGLRPSEGTGSAGSLRATENHLADMRRIAFSFIDGSKP